MVNEEPARLRDRRSDVEGFSMTSLRPLELFSYPPGAALSLVSGGPAANDGPPPAAGAGRTGSAGWSGGRPGATGGRVASRPSGDSDWQALHDSAMDARHPPAAPATATVPASRMLVVEDDDQVSTLLSTYLRRHAMEVDVAESAAGLRVAIAAKSYDVILLDLGLPDADGLDALRELRGHWSGALLIVSGRGDAGERTVGLELGADDFVGKPFDLRELLARIHSVRRRVAAPAVVALPVAYELDGLRVDLAARDVIDRDGRPLNLTLAEFELLQALAATPGRAITRDALLTAVHGRQTGPYDRAIDMQVARLRRRIERDPSAPRLIRSVRGRGYMLGVEPTAG